MPIKEITIEKIAKRTINTKYGEKEQVNIKPKNSDTWINGFKNKTNAQWNEGDTVKIDAWSTENNGKTFYNYKTVEVTNDEIKEQLDRIEALLTQPKQEQPAEQNDTFDDKVDNDDDLPF